MITGQTPSVYVDYMILFKDSELLDEVVVCFVITEMAIYQEFQLMWYKC